MPICDRASRSDASCGAFALAAGINRRNATKPRDLVFRDGGLVHEVWCVSFVLMGWEVPPFLQRAVFGLFSWGFESRAEPRTSPGTTQDEPKRTQSEPRIDPGIVLLANLCTTGQRAWSWEQGREARRKRRKEPQIQKRNPSEFNPRPRLLSFISRPSSPATMHCSLSTSFRRPVYTSLNECQLMCKDVCVFLG
jgi:hypothetical protein